MRLLVYSWVREYTLIDILKAFDKANILYEKVLIDVKDIDKSDAPQLFDLIDKTLKKNPGKYDAVFSVNYFPDVARACNENEVLYISWTYDCPLDIRNVQDTISLPTNRAFFFDRTQFEEYNNDSNTVFHYPLAVNAGRIKTIKYDPRYHSEVSFVGSIYSSAFPNIYSYLDDYYKGFLRGIIEAQKNLYGIFLAKDVLTESDAKELNDNLKKNDCPYTRGNQELLPIQFAVAMASEATFENRLLCLGLISKYHDLKWYTKEESQSLNNIKKCPPVDYINEMPKVFYSSNINLHIGLHAITSGISLRQLDIMSCGGFLLSSFQPELFDYFVPEEDFDYFTNPEEALEKCEFYLNHDEIREKITVSGCEKTNRLFNYGLRIKEMLEIAFR